MESKARSSRKPLIFIIIGILLMIFHFWAGRPRICPIVNLNDTVLYQFEKLFRFDFPDSAKIFNAALWGGKDWTLCAKIGIDYVDIDLFKKNSIDKFYPLQMKDIKREFKGLGWWEFNESEVMFSFKVEQGFTNIIFTNKNKVVFIYLHTNGSPNGFPSEIWENSSCRFSPM